MAEGSAGERPLINESDLLDDGLNQSLNRLLSSGVEDKWWRAILRHIEHAYVAPDFLRKPALQEWLSQVPVQQDVKRLARSLIINENLEDKSARNRLRESYANHTGEAEKLADGPIDVVVAFLAAGFLASIDAALKPLAALVQAGARDAQRGFYEVKQKIDALAEKGKAFPTDIVDRKIEDEVQDLRKRRFYVEVDTQNAAAELAQRIAEGSLCGGTDSVRACALAWCSRFLSGNNEPEKAKYYLELSKSLSDRAEARIAEAFIVSNAGDKAAALKILAQLESSHSRSAALMVVGHHLGATGALGWLKSAEIPPSSLDADGKLYLLQRQLDLGRWDEANSTLAALSDSDYTEAPALQHTAAIAYLLHAVPIDLRSTLLNQLPFDAAGFPLASSEAAVASRRTSIKHFYASAEAARRLGCQRIVAADEEYALWLELRGPDAAESALERLADQLRDPKSALRLVPLGLQFGLNLDIAAVEKAIDQQVALHGGITFDAAVARFAVMFTHKSPKEVVAYIDRHHNDLSTYFDHKALAFLQVEALARAGSAGKAREKLSAFQKEGLSEEEAERLRRIIEEAEGADPIELRKAQFRETNALQDLLMLVRELDSRQRWQDLVEFGQKLFDKTHFIDDAVVLARALSNCQEHARLAEFLEEWIDLRKQSRDLQMLYCWSLYHEGDLLRARDELVILSDGPSDSNYRALLVNLGIALGDWHSLMAFIATEQKAADSRTAEDLIGVAQLAHRIGAPNAKALTFAAATKANDDPHLLSAAYFLASTAGWEEDKNVVHWLHRAAQLSGEHGPIQKMSLEDIIQKKPEWDRHEAETWQKLGQGALPMFLAGKALNRSLINIMLFPAIANLSKVDPRRRGVIAAYSGKRKATTFNASYSVVGMDATSLLTISFLGLLDKVLDGLDKIFVPHSTMLWLLEEKQNAAFHQPSRIRDAHKVRNLLATGKLQKLNPSAASDSELAAEVGDELAQLLAEAELDRGEDKRQRIVVQPSPVHRIGSLMAEEADLRMHHSVICGCMSVVWRLRDKGEITAEELERAQAYLQLHEKPWPNEPEIADGAELYLDGLAMNRLLHLGMLERLQGANLAAFASPQEVSDCDALIAYEGISDQVTASIESVRSAVHSRIISGKIKLGRQRVIEWEGEGALPSHPTVDALSLAAVCDAVVIDDRFINQHENIAESDGSAAILSTLDLLDALVAEGVLSTRENMECRSRLRRAGYMFVPVRSDELLRHLQSSPLVEGRLAESAELRAIRENLLCARMIDWLQMPSEAPWLDELIRVLIQCIRELWKVDVEISRAEAASNWILPQLDVRGWVHRLSEDTSTKTIEVGRAASFLGLLTLPNDVPPERKKAYWDWLDRQVLMPIKERSPALFDWIVENQKSLIAELIDGYDEEKGAV
jgi:hypothetical protein